MLLEDHFCNFSMHAFVVLVNLYYGAQLIEGITCGDQHKILPWIIFNGFNLIQIWNYFFNDVNSRVGFLTLSIFCTLWLTILFLYIETNKSYSPLSPGSQSFEA